MKLFFVWAMAFIFSNFKETTGQVLPTKRNENNQLKGYNDSLQPVRIINNSSLKQIPGIIKDLLVAFRESFFNQEVFLNNNSIVLDLQDAVFKNYDTAAVVRNNPEDSVYHVKLNLLYKQASDKALAATIIHEVLHCLLLHIRDMANLGDANALAIVQKFNVKIMNPFGMTADDFYDLMNRGEIGEHELMYQLFYRDMVSVILRFAQIHREVFLHSEDAEFLMWCGLQKTTAYEKLSFDEKSQITSTILREKGVAVMY